MIYIKDNFLSSSLIVRKKLKVERKKVSFTNNKSISVTPRWILVNTTNVFYFAFFIEKLRVVISVIRKGKYPNVKEILCCKSCFCYSGVSYLVGGLWGAPIFPARPFSSWRMVWAPLGLREQSRREGALQVQPGLSVQDSLRERLGQHSLFTAYRKSQSIKYNQLAINGIITHRVTKKNMTLCSFLTAIWSKAWNRPYLFLLPLLQSTELCK